LLLTEAEDIKEFTDSLERQAKALKEEIVRICWWMRGSISYTEAHMLSPQDRDLIGKLISENLEASKKVGQPIY
jgi:hypothetical protein